MNKSMQLLLDWSLIVCIIVFGAGSAYAEEGKKLTGAELKQILSMEIYVAGWSERGYRYMEAYAPDGSYRALTFAPGNAPEFQSTGTWRVEGDELFIRFQGQNIGMNTPPTSPRNRYFKWRQNGKKYTSVMSGHEDEEDYFYVLGD
jgi:hypothetical protein